MDENIVISNEKKFFALKQNFLDNGLDSIHILSDFDKTLTAAFSNGKFRPSLISVLRDGNYLSLDYATRAHELYDKYHGLEVDDSIPVAERKRYMAEWWDLHLKLLIECGLNKKDLSAALDSTKIQFRAGFKDLINFLDLYKIPLVIMSASGIGKESILIYLQNRGLMRNNIFTISNSFTWDSNSMAIKYNEPIIHSLNKDDTLLKDFPDIFNEVKNRKNVILLGDGIGDVGMVDGFDYDNLLKIGFLSTDIEENLQLYKDNFDIVIINDGPITFLRDFLQDILNG